MNCAGIDVSTKAVDIVLLELDTDQATWHHYDLQAGDLADRLMSVRRTLPHPASVFWADTVAIGIERPAGKFGVAQVMAAWGAVLCTLPNKTLVKCWMPSEWRKACGLKGNASKDEVGAWCDEHRFPDWTRQYDEAFQFRDWQTVEQLQAERDKQDTWTQDAYDAHCIAWATKDALEHQKQAA